MLSTEDLLNLIKHGKIEEIQEALSLDPSLANAHEPDSTSAVLTAAYYGQSAIARLLVKYGATLDLFAACAVGELDTVRKIVAAQPELVNAVAPDGFQPLGLAAFFGHLDVAQFLIDAGAAVDSPSHNPLKVMPLHSAAAGSRVEIARLLIDHGAPVNARQAEDFTPLHSAAQNGSLEIIQALLAAGAEVNVRDSEGKTPLAFALAENHQEAVDLLLENGASA
ncbi:MAG: ankyrin repeat domain-containing protein [Bellilinea sp.]